MYSVLLGLTLLFCDAVWKWTIKEKSKTSLPNFLVLSSLWKHTFTICLQLNLAPSCSGMCDVNSRHLQFLLAANSICFIRSCLCCTVMLSVNPQELHKNLGGWGVRGWRGEEQAVLRWVLFRGGMQTESFYPRSFWYCTFHTYTCFLVFPPVIVGFLAWRWGLSKFGKFCLQSNLVITKSTEVVTSLLYLAF